MKRKASFLSLVAQVLLHSFIFVFNSTIYAADSFSNSCEVAIERTLSTAEIADHACIIIGEQDNKRLKEIFIVLFSNKKNSPEKELIKADLIKKITLSSSGEASL